MKPRLPLRAALCITTCPRSFPTRGALLGGVFTGTKPAERRNFSRGIRFRIEGQAMTTNAIPAEQLNNKVSEEEQADFDHRVAADKEKQIRTPWMREGSDQPPVARQRSAGAMTKGKLLTTPSRMLKLVLPLTTMDANSDRKDVEPLALLVHPSQPLSYLERLIQSELPTIKQGEKEKIPNVYFRAEDSNQEFDGAETTDSKSTPVHEPDAEPTPEEEADFETADETKIDGKLERTGKLNRKTPEEAAALRGGSGQGGVESYSGLGREAPSDAEKQRKFVRWSSSTEIGDFIRDAARGQEFAVEIEGAPNDIRVGVPSFNDRTYYLRMRLRNTSGKIAKMADVKKECDEIAHRGAQRVAMGGFGILCGWWYLVYRLTFETDLGWDVMEPITYLVGLSTVIGAYIWFLYHNREVSYRSAMNLTISKRQQKLYADKGFDLRKWESLIEDGNALRQEIKRVASEYDVEWDELEDEKDKSVTQALRKDREKKNTNGGDKDKKDEEDED